MIVDIEYVGGPRDGERAAVQSDEILIAISRMRPDWWHAPNPEEQVPTVYGTYTRRGNRMYWKEPP